MKVKNEHSAGGIVYKRETGKYTWLVVENKTITPYWGFPKGHIADKISHEKAEEAALREVAEEGGIQAKIISSSPIEVSYEFRQGDLLHKKHVSYFLMEYISGDTNDHDHEVAKAKFIPENQVLDLLTFLNDKHAFHRARRLLNK